MKNRIFCSLPILLFGAIVAQAQDVTVLYETKLENKKVPAVIMEQVGKDFPGAKLDETYLIPAKLYEQKWVVIEKNDVPNDVDKVEVYLKGKGMRYSAVYSPDGKLLHSREVQKGVALPTAVSKVIADHYPKWKENRDREVLKDGKKEITHYIVFLKNGWREQRLVISPAGKVLHRFEL